MQSYAALQDGEQEESGVLIHVVESSRSRWNHIEDLDSFFARMYRYHQRHGFFCMMLQEFLELVIIDSPRTYFVTSSGRRYILIKCLGAIRVCGELYHLPCARYRLSAPVRGEAARRQVAHPRRHPLMA